MNLQSQSKFLRAAAEEIRKEGHAGWGNTCEQAADAIDALLRERESAKAVVTDDLDYVPGELDRTAPVRIWLQIDTDGDSSDRDEPWPGADAVTWQGEPIGGLEIQYVRADLVVPMLASAQVPDARKLRLNGNVRQQSYDQGWNACRTAMLAAAPKTVLTESMDAQRYRLIRSGKSGIPLPLGSEALDVYLDLRLKVAPKPKTEE